MVNEAGGVNGCPLRLIAFDDQSMADHASRIAEELVFKHRVTALVGTGTLPISKAVAHVANRFRVPAFINSGYAIDPGTDLFVFNTAHKTEFAISCAFHYFLEEGITRLGLFMPPGPLGDLGSWLGRRLADRMGIRIVGEERFDLTESTMASPLGRLRSLRPGALFSFVTGPPAASVADQMAAMGFTIPLLVSHGNAHPRFLKLLSRNPVPIIVPSSRTTAIHTIPSDDPCFTVVTDFNNRHLCRYGEPANDYSAELADAIDLLAEGVRRAGDGDGERLRDAVEGIRDFKGIRGEYHLSPIDHYGTGVEQIVVLMGKNGRWHFSKAFSSVDLFEGFHDDRKGKLIRRVAGLLPPVGATQAVLPVDDDGSKAFSTSRTGLNCTQLGPDLYFSAKLFCQQKMEMIRAMQERDFERVNAALSRLLTIAVLQHFETPETLRLAILEIFLALFDSAVSEGASIEETVRMRQALFSQWEDIKEPEPLCLWIARAVDSIKARLATSRNRMGGDLRERVAKFVEDHLGEDLTVERIAQEVGLSPSRLMHLMRSSYNVSIGACVTKARIEAAKRLLRCSDMTLSGVACAVGYNDHGYFTRVFKKQTGETPQLYRKRTFSILVP
jgi:branched-chain amino acid transport system substrate-binding protein